MDENRFFKWIWRIVSIGLLLLITAGLYSFIETEIKRDNIYDMDEREPISTLAKDPQKVEKWVLRVAPMADNSDYTVLALYSKYNKVKALNESYYEPKGYYQDMAKNILFVNTKDNSSYWLFPTNNQLILKYQSDIYIFLERNPYYPIYKNKIKEEKVKFIYYTLINKDTNGDKIITKADHLNFAISDISGKNYKVVIEDIETIINIKTVNKDTINIIYQKDGIAHSLKLNTNNFEIVSDIELPKVG